MVRRRRLARRYANRTVAGRALGEALLEQATLQKPIVLALPAAVSLLLLKWLPGSGLRWA